MLRSGVAAAGKPLHHDFADKAAAVDGEMVDVIGNISLVKAFGGLSREQRRFDATVEQELKARRRSLLYLERLRLTHAAVTVILIVGLLAWAIDLWQRHEATVGDVVLVCTLGISVLSATRDFAVALVDVTQHFARLSEALVTLLCPHELTDHPQAAALAPKSGASIVFERMSFAYSGTRGARSDSSGRRLRGGLRPASIRNPVEEGAIRKPKPQETQNSVCGHGRDYRSAVRGASLVVDE